MHVAEILKSKGRKVVTVAPISASSISHSAFAWKGSAPPSSARTAPPSTASSPSATSCAGLPSTAAPDPADMHVADLMTKAVVTVSPDDTISHVRMSCPGNASAICR